MATVRIYYSREDQDYANHELYVFPGIIKPQGELLFPSSNIEEDYPVDYPREKYQFTTEGTLAYVDVNTNDAENFGFSVKRKDLYLQYGGELSDTNSQGEIPYEDYYSLIMGYVYNADTKFYSSVYIKENSQYCYTDDSYTDIAVMYGEMVPREEVDYSTHDEWENVYKDIRLWATVDSYTTITLPDSEQYKYNTGAQNEESSQLDMLYLNGKTFTVGENDMDLSISADALNTEKADALQVLEKAVANCLYKLGEVIADFDEAAFLADVDGYKATKDQSNAGTIDYLKVCLDARALLV